MQKKSLPNNTSKEQINFAQLLKDPEKIINQFATLTIEQHHKKLVLIKTANKISRLLDIEIEPKQAKKIAPALRTIEDNLLKKVFHNLIDNNKNTTIYSTTKRLAINKKTQLFNLVKQHPRLIDQALNKNTALGMIFATHTNPFNFFLPRETHSVKKLRKLKDQTRTVELTLMPSQENNATV
jgi:hypothetical protein